MNPNNVESRHPEERPKELNDALNGTATRDVSLQFWTWVAAGNFNDETGAWLKATARRVLEADNTPDDKRRADKVLKAVGLKGRKASYSEARGCTRLWRFMGVSDADIAKRLTDKNLLPPKLDDSRSFVGRVRKTGQSIGKSGTKKKQSQRGKSGESAS